MKLKLNNIKKCRKCNLYINQLPLLDKKDSCDVMWVGLSAKKVDDIDKNYPLEENTNSGLLIKEIEDILPSLNYYKTNLVKCLPLDNKGKIRYPSTNEMNKCISNLLFEIEVMNPKIIFLLGNNVYNFISKYIEKNNIKLNLPIKYIEHPSYIYVYKKKYKDNYIEKVINEIKKVINMNKVKRCKWVNMNNPLYIKYHDEEWGVPVYDDHKLYEMLILESFQAGLSWECVLNKREYFEECYDNFDIDKICDYDDIKVNELLNNKNIIRNKLKINASINNSKIFKEIQKEYGSFSNYIWKFTNNKVIYEVGVTSSKLSDTISEDLKRRGMKFVGTTIIYSYLQAVGIINSHDNECMLYKGKE